MIQVVPDSSVVAKWFLIEEDTESALALARAHEQGAIRLTAPELLAYEVANAVASKTQMGLDRVLAAMEVFFDTDIEMSSIEREVLDTALRLSDLTGLALYDAYFGAFALRRDAYLVTADQKMVRGLQDIVRVVPLDRWPPAELSR